MRYVVTGPHENVTTGQLWYVRSIVGGLKDVDEFTSGGAWKVDTAASVAAWLAHTRAHHRVVLPEGLPYDPAWDAPMSGVEIVRVPGGYMARNDALVTYGDVLLAFPPTASEVLRSGTWATIRRARAAGLEVRYFPLDKMPAKPLDTLVQSA